MPDLNFDYLIVGQGLAGTSMALHLHDTGKRVLIVGDTSQPSSSKVAAGICNPLTGKKLVKTWLADDLFPYAKKFYSNLEIRFGEKFYHEIPVYRPFRSIEEQNTYLAQTADPAIAPYVSKSTSSVDLSGYVHSEFGGLEVVQSAWVDLPLLLDRARQFFIEAGTYSEANFDAGTIEINEEFVSWNGKRFGKIIFCQGFMALENQFFNWLPFTPVKGQILEIATEARLQPYIINQGIFMLPVSDFEARVGATYSWDPLDWEPTTNATNELDSKLGTLLKVPYSIQSVKAGIRPSVRDRRPLIGLHPVHSNVAIFNGLGTKGVTLGPYFAKQFAEHLESGKELNPAVNIKRYFSLYFH